MRIAAITSNLPSDTALGKAARVAGLLYLAAIVIGPFSLIYVPNVIVVTANAAATAENIRSHEALLRFGIVGDVLTGTVFLFVVFALYRLLKDVGRHLAVAMVVLGGVVPLPIFCINAMNWSAAILIANGVGYWSTFSQNQRDALMMMFMQLHREGNIINSFFWGLWLLPFGILVVKSRFLPRFLGGWLLVNGVAYLTTSTLAVISPSYPRVIDYIAQPALLGEIAIMLGLSL